MSDYSQTGRFIPIPGGARAFLPAPMPPDPPLRFDGEAQALLSDADQKIGRLDGIGETIPDPEFFAHGFLRKEAVLSSQIEGTQSSLSDVLAVEENLRKGAEANEELNAVRALRAGFDSGLPVCARLLCETHGILLAGARGGKSAPGEFRRAQNWIGGDSPVNAMYVPPPVGEIPRAMGEWEKFVNADPSPLPPLVVAALAHSQFESIHPFLDGNGRVGRLLILLILRDRKALSRPLLFLSAYFKRQSRRVLRPLAGDADERRFRGLDQVFFARRGGDGGRIDRMRALDCRFAAARAECRERAFRARGRQRRALARIVVSFAVRDGQKGGGATRRHASRGEKNVASFRGRGDFANRRRGGAPACLAFRRVFGVDRYLIPRRGGITAESQPLDGVGAADFLLQLQDAEKQGFGGGRAAGDIDIDRHDAVAAAHDGIRIMIIAAAVGARSHRDNPARFAHLVEYAAQGGRHFVAEGAGDNHHIGLARAGAENDSEAVEVVARRAGVHHFDGATSESESHRPHRSGARPIDEFVDGGRHIAAREQGCADIVGRRLRGRQRIRDGGSGGGGVGQSGRGEDARAHSQSSAPFFHS